jgi:hypothetical protein
MGLSKKEGGAGRLARTGCVPRRLNVVEMLEEGPIPLFADGPVAPCPRGLSPGCWMGGGVAECKRAF